MGNRILTNKHTSAAAIGYAICTLGGIWLPHFQSQFETTAKFLVGYGFLMSGNSTPTPTQNPEQK